MFRKPWSFVICVALHVNNEPVIVRGITDSNLTTRYYKSTKVLKSKWDLRWQTQQPFWNPQERYSLLNSFLRPRPPSRILFSTTDKHSYRRFCNSSRVTNITLYSKYSHTLWHTTLARSCFNMGPDMTMGILNTWWSTSQSMSLRAKCPICRSIQYVGCVVFHPDIKVERPLYTSVVENSKNVYIWFWTFHTTIFLIMRRIASSHVMIL